MTKEEPPSSVSHLRLVCLNAFFFSLQMMSWKSRNAGCFLLFFLSFHERRQQQKQDQGDTFLPFFYVFLARRQIRRPPPPSCSFLLLSRLPVENIHGFYIRQRERVKRGVAADGGGDGWRRLVGGGGLTATHTHTVGDGRRSSSVASKTRTE